MAKVVNKPATIDNICTGLKILEKYKHDAMVLPCNRKNSCLLLQAEEFKEITESDRGKLISLGWEADGVYDWYI